MTRTRWTRRQRGNWEATTRSPWTPHLRWLRAHPPLAPWSSTSWRRLNTSVAGPCHPGDTCKWYSFEVCYMRHGGSLSVTKKGMLGISGFSLVKDALGRLLRVGGRVLSPCTHHQANATHVKCLRRCVTSRGPWRAKERCRGPGIIQEKNSFTWMMEPLETEAVLSLNLRCSFF